MSLLALCAYHNIKIFERQMKQKRILLRHKNDGPRIDTGYAPIAAN